ncbi:efflux RND transporter periplasmic adaptor subunit [Pontiella sulfatireligans]|uniref:Multidrug efflux pump subunit AcrA n=1 Tax=Pontiella sulfatireligans TaxID=2750658 RepID=A0A6C2UP96_9BACT|nr:efflux RND transporter periplasmic adaptor subunit [Pontiella sulfatireligans]VGO21137.1 Multidrug efflux pump subunit AcrA [Pontiella sulfatireligans]
MLNQQRNQPVAVFAAAVAAALLMGGCGPHGSQGTQQAAPPEVSVVTIETERLVLTMELPGRTAAYRVAEIRPQVNGLILKRAFTEGSDVNAGDLLYQIDPAPYQAMYDQAKAAVAMAEANLPALRSREERFKKLVESHAVGQQDYDDALAALHQLEGQLGVSMAAMESAQINLSYTPIKAPIPGRIGRSGVTEGALVTAYQPVSLATVQQLDPIYVDVPQSTTEMLRLKRRLADGQLNPDGASQNKVVIIQEDGTPYPEEGSLEFRDITVDPTTGSVILRIVVPNPDGALLPGMFVRAVLKEGVNETAVFVPQQCVSRTQKGEPYMLIVDAEGKVAQRMLSLDRAIGDRWLVSSGLDSGDRVIIEGVQRVRPGVSVKAVPFDAASSAPAKTN